MLFFLRKLVEEALVPLGFSLLLIVLALVLCRRVLALAALVVLYVFSMPIIARLLLSPLEHVYPAETPNDAPNADAVVVLSGGILRGVAPPGVQWGDAANRFFTGLDLAQTGKAKLLILSAGGPPTKHSINQGDVLRRFTLARGFPQDRLVITPYVLTTEDEARAVSRVPGVHSILLVTSAFHMARAVLLFQARGLQVDPFPTDERALGNFPMESSFALVPDASALRESEAAIREYYGLAVYRSILFINPSKLRKN